MTDSADGERPSGHDETTARGPARRPEFTAFHLDAEGNPAHPATESAGLGPVDDPANWHGFAAQAPGFTEDRNRGYTEDRNSGYAEERYGPGVPQSTPAVGGPATSAEEVWRTGHFPSRPARSGRLRRRAGAALTAALLIAAGAVIYLRLHHVPLAVTGVAITSQLKNGCAVDVTGRISTTGGAGTVSYEWVFTPQVTAPQPLSQSVTAGQHALYVTVSDQGTGHGQSTQQVTLQVLGPGQGKASAHVVINC